MSYKKKKKKLVFLYHHDVLCAMGRMNPLNTFLSLARLLRVFGRKLLNGVAIGGWLSTISQLKIYYLGKRYLKTIYLLITFC